MLDDKSIYDLTPFTHLDYPNHLSCIVWFAGCNMRCDYCYNRSVVFAKEGVLSPREVLIFLKKRVGLLDGVVLSGGEATRYNLIVFASQIKALGFDVKLDTNGTNPEMLKELIERNLIDYIALDYKAPESKFSRITKSSQWALFKESLSILVSKKPLFEVRTTLHYDLLNEIDINLIVEDLETIGYQGTLFIQEYRHTDTTLGNLSPPKSRFNRSLLSNKIPIEFR